MSKTVIEYRPEGPVEKGFIKMEPAVHMSV